MQNLNQQNLAPVGVSVEDVVVTVAFSDGTRIRVEGEVERFVQTTTYSQTPFSGGYWPESSVTDLRLKTSNIRYSQE